MKLRIKKKEEGSSFVHFIPILLTIIIAAYIILSFTQYIIAFNKKDEIDLIARQYILRMETQGYLTHADEDDLIRELEEIGLYNISLDGTTLVEAGYGEVIKLHIQGDLEMDWYTMDENMNKSSEKDILKINIIKASTSQQ